MSNPQENEFYITGFPSDYFVINPQAPKLLAIDVFNILTQNPITLLSSLRSEDKDSVIFSHKTIIRMIYMADDFLAQALQLLSRTGSYSPEFMAITEAIEFAKSILNFLENAGESESFEISNIAVKELLSSALKFTETAHDKAQDLPSEVWV